MTDNTEYYIRSPRQQRDEIIFLLREILEHLKGDDPNIEDD